ncbi:hypothetical protein [Siminovitchia acidinfaciens]|uniref:hypothetical protein n=1 Tax=Siminovitchia acidinfaciens TaxID=2321395 RepID=UPI001F409B8E|nr:hypothetical protein [Siminovitchia acidinfaciens]
MTRIPGNERDIIEQAIYLPMLLTVLQRDLSVVEQSPFKLKKPYRHLIEHTMREVQKELAEVKRYLHKNNIRVERMKSDEIFTMYLFLYKGYEEHHNYFNPRLRNKVEELLNFYLGAAPLKEGARRAALGDKHKANFDEAVPSNHSKATNFNTL